MGGVPIRPRPLRDVGVDIGDRDPDPDLPAGTSLADLYLVEVP